MTIFIDVVSDVICPWCFLGKRRLDKALAQLDGLDVEVAWRPFMLDPTIPRDGKSRHDYLMEKFGEERLKTIHDPLLKAGAEDGVPFRFDDITRTPNTLDAHRVIRWAHKSGKQHDVAERLFMSYWNKGEDIGNPAVLADAAEAAGMDGARTLADLATNLDADKVQGEIAMAGRMGITGVPTFVIGRKYGVVGAQPAEVIADAIRKVAVDWMGAKG